jgi:hypothetical protein
MLTCNISAATTPVCLRTAEPGFELLVSVVIFKAEQLAAAQPNGMLDPRLFLCLDEAGNCAAIKKLPNLPPRDGARASSC